MKLPNLVILICLFSFAVTAQYRFDSWTTDNGLPQASVNSILQTRDGFLWMTTFGGLVRYDGVRFDVFNSGNTKGLKTSRFLKLLEDKDGNLWITTEGQGITRFHDGIFTTYTTDDGLSSNQVGRIDVDSNGNLLLGEHSQTFEWKNEAFVPISIEKERENILFRTDTGAIWTFQDSHLRKTENGRDTVDLATDFSVLRVFQDSKERVWLAADKNLLLMLKDGKLTSYSQGDNFPNARFTTAFEDRQGAIWFGTTDGLVSYKDEKFTRYAAADGLVSTVITSIYQDRENTIWVGTQKGLNRLTARAVRAYSITDGLAAENIYPIFQDDAGKIWIGSWFGLTVFENGVFQNVGERFGAAKDNVTALTEDRDGNLWLGLWSGEIKRWKNGELTDFLQFGDGTNVRVIYQDKAGNMWFGTSENLVRFKDGKLTTFTMNDGLSGRQIFALHEDGEGRLWIGTDAGLTVFQNGQFTPFKGAGAEDSPANIVRSIYEDADGALWFGMYDSGLYRYKDHRFTHFTTNEGLFDNGAFQILEDDQANFWMSCNLGIYRVRKSELNDFAEGRAEKVISIPYNKRDGMLDSECNGGASPSGIKAQDGTLWFPTQKGVAVINPNAVPFNSEPPPVVIESLNVDNKPVDLTSPIQIQPAQTNLEINYAGLSFINPELVKFKYKLENLDKDWIDASTRRTAFYSHLPPGKYLFRVIAANRDGVWNEQGAAVEITVIAPFWRTWWFYGLNALTIFAVVIGVFLLRERELQRRQRVQAEFSRKLIESQERERKRIASEMHDSLGQYLLAIKNWAMFGLNSLPPENAAREYLTEVSDTTALALSEVREIAHNLRPYQLERLGLTNTLESMLKNLKTPIRISSEIENIDDAFSKDAEIVFYRIVQESVNNVIKHSGAANLWINIKRDDQNLSFICRDDGRGFDFAAAKNSPASGLGLNGIAERVKILNGSYQINSETGGGTTVSVTAPLKQ